ncbi:MAG: LexA family protein [Fluviibacter sp.]
MKPANPKNSHGGKRPGSGRKAKFGEPTSLMRVPESAKATVIDFLTELAEKRKAEPTWSSHLMPIKLADNPTSFKVPLFAHTIRAGFPSPADDYVADTLDLNEHLMPRKEASFLLRAKGESMIGVGIHDGDMLVVDRSITASDGLIVIAQLDGQFTVKTLEKKHGKVRLLPANPDFEPIELKDEQELQIWGVVTSVIHHFKS